MKISGFQLIVTANAKKKNKRKRACQKENMHFWGAKHQLSANGMS